MANKRISELSLRTPQTSDLMLIGDPTTGYSFKTTLSAITANLVPYSGATNNLNLGEFGLSTGYVSFDLSPTSTPTSQGTMYWDDASKTVALIMNGTTQKIGLDQFYMVKNSTGSTIAKGTAVGFAGTDGGSGHLLIKKFIADGSEPSQYYMGITSEDIANGAFGKVMRFGRLDGVNTSTFADGNILYVSTTVAGGFQTAVPVAPKNIIIAAAVINAANNGKLMVRETLGSNINNDEGVKIVSPTNGQVLKYNSTSSLWENANEESLAGYVPYTGATADLNLGLYNSISKNVLVNGDNTSQGGVIALKQFSSTSTGLTGYTALSAQSTDSLIIQYSVPAGYKQVYLKSNLISDNTIRNFSFPNASGTLALTTDIPSLSGYVQGTGTTNYVSKFTASGTIGNSQIFDNGSFVGINRNTDDLSGARFQVNGGIRTNSFLFVQGTSYFGDTMLINTQVDNLSGAKLQVNGAGTFSGSVSTTNIINTGSGSFTYLNMLNTTSNASNRNWSIITNAISFGDFAIRQSNAQGGDPISAGTDRLYISATGAATFSSSVSAGGSIKGYTAGLSAFRTYSKEATFEISAYQSDSGSPFTKTTDIVANADGGVASQMRFLTATAGGNPTTALFINPSGNLGLGVTPSAWNSSFRALQVGQTGVIGNNGNTVRYGNNFYFDTDFRYIQSSYASMIQLDAGNGDIRFYTAPSGTAGNAISFTQAMTLDASGRLLLGSIPVPTTDLLQVAGSVKSTGNIVSNGGSFFTNDNGRYGWGSGSAYMDGDAANGYIRFITASTERMRITGGGKFQFSNTPTSSSASSVVNYLSVTVNGTDYLIPLHNLP